MYLRTLWNATCCGVKVLRLAQTVNCRRHLVKGRYPSLADGERTSPGPNVFCSRFRRQTKTHQLRFGLASRQNINSNIGGGFQTFLPEKPLWCFTSKYGKLFQLSPSPRATTRGTPGGNPSLFSAGHFDIRLPPSRERGNSPHLEIDHISLAHR